MPALKLVEDREMDEDQVSMDKTELLLLLLGLSAIVTKSGLKMGIFG